MSGDYKLGQNIELSVNLRSSCPHATENESAGEWITIAGPMTLGMMRELWRETMTLVSLAERDTKGKRGSRIGDVQARSISDGDVGPYDNPSRPNPPECSEF